MTAPERGTATLAPELARRVGHVASTVVAAGRSRSRSPHEHPAAGSFVDREFRYAVEEALDPDAAAVDPLAQF